MGEETKSNRNRNTALVLIGAGLFLLLDHTIGFFPILAGFLMLLGVHRIRSHPQRKDRIGYVLILIGAVILLGNHFAPVLAVIMIAVGYFFIKSRQYRQDDQNGEFIQKHKLIDSVRLGKEPWILKNSSMASLIGEINIDLSLVILEQRETTLILQGVIGDIDIIVPEDIGISVTTSIVFGQIDVAFRKEAGVMNKLHWTSSNYDSCDHRVKLIVSYIVGDIDIKIL